MSDATITHRLLGITKDCKKFYLMETGCKMQHGYPVEVNIVKPVSAQGFEEIGEIVTTFGTIKVKSMHVLDRLLRFHFVCDPDKTEHEVNPHLLLGQDLPDGGRTLPSPATPATPSSLHHFEPLQQLAWHDLKRKRDDGDGDGDGDAEDDGNGDGKAEDDIYARPSYKRRKPKATYQSGIKPFDLPRHTTNAKILDYVQRVTIFKERDDLIAEYASLLGDVLERRTEPLLKIVDDYDVQLLLLESCIGMALNQMESVHIPFRATSTSISIVFKPEINEIVLVAGNAQSVDHIFYGLMHTFRGWVHKGRNLRKFDNFSALYRKLCTVISLQHPEFQFQPEVKSDLQPEVKSA